MVLIVRNCVMCQYEETYNHENNLLPLSSQMDDVISCPIITWIVMSVYHT